MAKALAVEIPKLNLSESSSAPTGGDADAGMMPL